MKLADYLFMRHRKGTRVPFLRNSQLLCIIALLGFALIYWWARVQHTDAANAIPAGSNMDMYVYHLPMHEYGFSELRDGAMPLWNPYTNCGMPFLATYQLASFYPLNFLHWFFSSPLAFSLTYLLHSFLAGLFMYLWMRKLESVPVAAVFAGTAYMLCSFVCYPLTWPHIIRSHIWIPLIFLLVHRTFLRARWTDTVLLGIAVSCQFLTGYADGFVYTMYGALAYLIYLSLVRPAIRERGVRLFGRSLMFSLAGLVLIPALLTAIQWIPTAQLSALSTRPPEGLTKQAILFGGSLYPSTFFKALMNPDSFGWSQYTLYPGIVTLVMAVFAFFCWKRWRELVFFSLLAVVPALVAFGSHTAFFEFYFFLPAGNWFRLPTRLLILTAFSVATLAGLGCNHLVRDVLTKPVALSKKVGRYVIFLGICAVFIFLLPKSASLYVLVLLVGCLLAASGRSANIVGALAVVLVGLDLILYIKDPVTYPWITRDVFPELHEEKEFLREKVGLDRVHLFHRKHDWKNYLVNANFELVERIRGTSGYETLSLQRYAEFCAFLETGAEPSQDLPFTGALRWTSDSLHPQMLNLLGARYIVDDPGRELYPEQAPPNEMPKKFKLRKVFSGELTIYENPNAAPRAFYASNVEVIHERRTVLERLADRSFDYRKTIILEEEPRPLPAPTEPPAKASAPEVVVKPQNEREIHVLVDVPTPGFIFLNDIYVPGWQAWVDGNPSPIYRADYLFMAIPVNAGKHSIEVIYRPWGFSAGKWILLLSAVPISLSLAFDFARRRAAKLAPWENEGKA